MIETILIKVATSTDLEGILELQFENQTAQGGSLSGAMNRDQIEEMMVDMPQIVAYLGEELVGFLLTSSQAVQKNRPIPIVDAMFASYAGNQYAYIYGPVCVSSTQRGKGLAQLMFDELQKQQPNREGILFIRSDNEASIRAHEKMGMHKVGDFNFKEASFYVYAYTSTT